MQINYIVLLKNTRPLLQFQSTFNNAGPIFYRNCHYFSSHLEYFSSLSRCDKTELPDVFI